MAAFSSSGYVTKIKKELVTAFAILGGISSATTTKINRELFLLLFHQNSFTCYSLK